MGSSPLCYKPSFVEISPPIPEKIFEGFLPLMGMVAIIGHVTSIILMNFYFHVHETLHTKFG